MISKLIFWYLHKQYLKLKPQETIFYIKGIGKDFPKYMLYTENERVYKNFDKI